MTGRRSVFLIHGMWGKGAYWARFAARLEAAGYRVAAPDLLHHDIAPDDPPPDGLGTLSLIDYLDDLEAKLKAFDERAVIIGHSMGGLLAQQLAARGRGSALIALAPAPSAGMWPIRLKPLKVFGPILMRPGWWRRPHKPSWEGVRATVFNAGVPEDEARREFANYVWDSGRVLFELSHWWLDRRRASAVDRGRITVPTLIIGGRQDAIVPIGWIRAAARAFGGRAAYEEFRDFGHWLVGEPALDPVATRVLGFLEGLQADQACGAADVGRT